MVGGGSGGRGERKRVREVGERRIMNLGEERTEERVRDEWK